MTVFAIPFLVPSQNDRERMHWRLQREEVTRAFLLCRAHGCKVPPPTGHRTVIITSYRRQLMKDHANLVGGCKGLVDGIVRAGLLLDDSIKLASFEYRQAVLSRLPADLRKDFGGRPCTAIEITDTPAESTAKPPEMGKR